MSTITTTQAIDGSILLSNRVRQPEEMQSAALQVAHELKVRAQGLIDALEGPTDVKRDVAIREAQANVRGSTRELERLTIQPSDFLFQLSVSQQLFVCIHWLCYFKVVFHVPTGSGNSISYADLACKADVPFGTMRSVIRMAMIYGFLREAPDGSLQHTPLSCSFATDLNIYNWMMYVAKETAPTVAHFVKASERWPESQDKTETAYSLSRGTDLSFFDHINASSERANEFGTYMKSQAANKQANSVHYLREGFDWASLGTATVVDVGGGGGDASISLAERYADLTFIVQDLPTAIETARERGRLLPKNVAQRLEFQEHDFFEAQPVVNAVYLLRMILHDWPDHDCVKILQQLSAVMENDSRIIIMDMVLPLPGSTSLEHEAVLRQKDLVMRQNFNAKEREREEWEALVAKVGMRIVHVATPQGSQHSVLEVVKT